MIHSNPHKRISISEVLKFISKATEYNDPIQFLSSLSTPNNTDDAVNIDPLKAITNAFSSFEDITQSHHHQNGKKQRNKKKKKIHQCIIIQLIQ